MNKNCPFCQSLKIKKHGIQNNTQRYFCNECHKCHKTFILKN
ncbi:IS1/IS1595 family N-terminal zinc-binding domain-containing protein [Glaesserella parasuis]